MLNAIPVKFFTLINQSVAIADADSATQFPQTLLVVVPRCICLNVSLHMKLFVKLFEENALHKLPPVRLLDGVDFPPLCHDTILNHARITNQRVHTIRGHHRNAVFRIDSRSRVLLRLTTGEEQKNKQTKTQKRTERPNDTEFPPVTCTSMKVGRYHDTLSLLLCTSFICCLINFPLSEPTLIERQTDIDTESILSNQVIC